MEYSIRGLPIRGSIGLGQSHVRGLRREPSPPAMMIAFNLIHIPFFAEIAHKNTAWQYLCGIFANMDIFYANPKFYRIDSVKGLIYTERKCRMRRNVKMKKIFMLVLAMLWLVLPAAQAVVPAYMEVVNCEEWVSLRLAPDKGSDRIEKVKLGETVR